MTKKKKRLQFASPGAIDALAKVLSGAASAVLGGLIVAHVIKSREKK